MVIEVAASDWGAMESLFDSLLSTPQRETAGSLAQDRFDFQAHWGITHLLELHEQNEDYAIAFEFHDDIFVISYAAGAPKVRFYQVKTKDLGTWTLKQITARPKGKKGHKASIIGKLFANKQKFPDHTEHLGFVSNAPGDFVGKQYPCKFSDIDASDYSLFLAALKSEFPNVECSQEAPLFHYHRTKFTLDGYETFLRGRVSEFIQKTCGDIERGHEAFRLTLLDQCKKRTKHIADISDISQLLGSKFVRRSDLEGWLNDLKRKNHQRPSWDGSQIHLHPISAGALREFRQQWEKYDTDRFQTADASLHQLRTSIRKTIESFLKLNPDIEVKAMVDAVADIVAPAIHETAPHFSMSYIKAGVLYEYQSSESQIP